MIAPATELAPVHVAEGLDLNPSECCTQTLGAIAAKGGGKSYLAGVVVEGLYAAGAPFAVFDPIGNWQAVTLDADGKSPGLGVVVIGGERADVMLDEDHAELLGDYLVANQVSAVLDVSELSKSRRKQYVALVAEAMFRAARRVKVPYMVVLEEAQLFAPQHAAKGEERMLGAITDIVRLGRNHGLGSMLITQRPQSVSKEVLNQVECLFVGQLRGPQERKAIAGWISEQSADGARAGLDELPKLAPGEFFCWSPSWLRTFRKVRVAKKRTYDGSSTPVLGQRAKALPSKGARGLESVIMALHQLGPEAPLEKPVVVVEQVQDAKLIAENRKLREQLAALDKQCLQNASSFDELRRRYHRATDTLEKLGSLIQGLDSVFEEWRLSLAAGVCRECGCTDDDCSQCVAKTGAPCHWVEPDLCSACAPEPPKQVTAKTIRRIRPEDAHLPEREPPLSAGLKARLEQRQERRRRIEHDTKMVATAVSAGYSPNSSPSGLDRPASIVLSMLAWQRGPIPKARLALLCRYSAKGGGFGNILSRLRTAGFITGSGELEITDEGRKEAGTVRGPPRQPKALIEWWLAHPQMDGAMRKILAAMSNLGRPVTSTDLATAAGYAPNTGGFNNPLSRLRTLGLVLGKGKEKLRLPPELTP